MKINSKIAWQIIETLYNQQLLSIIENKFINKENIKEIRVPFYQAIYQLVETGCLEYTKLCYENYYYWWYEMPKGQERLAKKNIFTCNVDNFTLTYHGRQLFELMQLDYYSEQRSYWGFYDFMEEYTSLENKINKYKHYIEYNQHFTETYNKQCLEYIQDVMNIYNYKKIKNDLFE